MSLPYNRNDKKSIIDYSKKLEGKTLRQVCGNEILASSFSGKGNFGQMLEKFYFHYEPNSKSEADFSEVGMELKSTPLKQLKNKNYRSKERLVLSIIDYLKIVQQSFEESDFMRKSSSILLVIYEHEKGLNAIDTKIKIVDEWNFPATDLEIIKKDFETIKQKVLDGKAHEISEGDTFYLGACTKGVNKDSLRDQPFSKTKAKQRAYSLKQGYVNHIIASLSREPVGNYGKLIQSPEIAKKYTIEDIVLDKFKKYYGMSIPDILSSLKIDINEKAKGFFASLTKAILGIELNNEIDEFEKSDIIIKTVRLKENSLPKEDISFPTFKFEDIVKEDWEESDFKSFLDKKFLFVFYQFENDLLVLRNVKFWNMPSTDKNEAKRVWIRTKEIVENGSIVKLMKGTIRVTNFPSKKFSKVSHVRPHALNANDCFPLPIADELTKSKEYTKHSFWLNNSYVRDEIYLKS